MEHIIPFIEGKLKLRVKREKTSVAFNDNIKLLEYGFYPTKDGVKLRVNSKCIAKMKDRIFEKSPRESKVFATKN